MEIMNMPGEKPGLRLLDEKFAEWLVANFAGAMPASNKTQLALLAKAVSHAVFLKHTCLELDKVAALAEPLLASLLEGITPQQARALLSDQAGKNMPLVCSADGRRVWLQKYHYFEAECASHLNRLAQERGNMIRLEPGLLHPRISSEQQQAVEMALSRGLAVITGGPGTGKTFTVGQILVQMLKHNPACRIQLAAPTGKAGQRMTESIRSVLPHGNVEAKTLHSLLGIGYHSPKPRYNRNNRLMLDVLIVDEASMVDLPMMYRLLEALPDSAKLILLGDKDQLASVEAGSVLAELCQGNALAGCRINLSESRRFAGGSEIGSMARWLIGEEKKPCFAGSHVRIHPGINASVWQPRWLDVAAGRYQELRACIRDGEPVTRVLQRQQDFQLLCALRKGPYGVAGINSVIEKALGRSGSDWYPGQPVIILQNDRSRKLYNGDVGMVLPLAADNQSIDTGSANLKACFLAGVQQVAGSPGFTAISKSQIPAHETCYALTVHKSQGSEYEQVMIVLPDSAEEVRNNPVLTRELAYTALTRAKTMVDLYGGDGVLEMMAARRTVRMSGLAAMLA